MNRRLTRYPHHPQPPLPTPNSLIHPAELVLALNHYSFYPLPANPRCNDGNHMGTTVAFSLWGTWNTMYTICLYPTPIPELVFHTMTTILKLLPASVRDFENVTTVAVSCYPPLSFSHIPDMIIPFLDLRLGGEIPIAITNYRLYHLVQHYISHPSTSFQQISIPFHSHSSCIITAFETLSIGDLFS